MIVCPTCYTCNKYLKKEEIEKNSFMIQGHTYNLCNKCWREVNEIKNKVILKKMQIMRRRNGLYYTHLTMCGGELVSYSDIFINLFERRVRYEKNNP